MYILYSILTLMTMHLAVDGVLKLIGRVFLSFLGIHETTIDHILDSGKYSMLSSMVP